MASVKFDLFNASPEALKKMTDKELTALAKRGQRFVNDRIRRLEEAGLRSQQSTSGLKPQSLRTIKDRKSAIRAIQRGRVLLFNPVSTPGKIHKLQREYGVKVGSKPGRGYKIVIDPETGKTKIVAAGTTGYIKFGDSFKDFDTFKDWAEDHMNWDSEEVFRSYYWAKTHGKDPVEYWESQLEKESENEPSGEDLRSTKFHPSNEL